MGLAMGSMPFILKTNLSFSQLAFFSLSTYPYSLKLLWAPFVDSMYLPKLGRRKSWIIPSQLQLGAMMFWLSLHTDYIYGHPENHLVAITVFFTVLVLLAATQDIAVDGWTLTLLPKEHLSYASTCQMIGLTTGFFSSFTVFFAFNSPEFVKMLHLPILTLSAYLRFWAFVCWSITVFLLFKNEEETHSSEEVLSLSKVYSMMWRIIRLKNVMSLCAIHLVAGAPFIASGTLTTLKLYEKGLKQEQLSFLVLADYVVHLFAGYLAGRWGKGSKPLKPWIYAFCARLGLCLTSIGVVALFHGPSPSIAILGIVAVNFLATQFVGAIQSVGMGAFQTKIADPLIGGTYMTLLNTAGNFGGTWPKYFVMRGMDFFTRATCHVTELGPSETSQIVSDFSKQKCTDVGGTYIIQHDGYYVVSAISMVLGLLIFVLFINGAVRKLQGLPTSAWRLSATGK
ncbi:hypothetical protein SISNIDRAFT_551622 [Sistotremastrum niveocremeum HHB9708]|uniref:MFS general substrate transporter n=1 Tax=Sistotremastrum niveocremeum HHB9708 TaxID=1314777 RepID=A0A164R722_9AGAM|nr:hypothetical protein SISNIDRAFT_551622 [Sistotremastrum niveocremeum HHB9708]